MRKRKPLAEGEQQRARRLFDAFSVEYICLQITQRFSLGYNIGRLWRLKTKIQIP
ncbi:MAG TPA: hypothetical protein VGB02_03125 [Pyrinomonadaceae bacterium]|jgi:hypothetical protein